MFFVPSTIVTFAVQSYFIPYFFIFHDFKSDMMMLCNEQTKVAYTYFPKKVPICGKSNILIQL